MATPMPGRPVRGSATGAPVMALFDLLGRRWALGILWTLAHEGPTTFRRLQDLSGAKSPSVLNSRLKELREAGLIATSEDGYCATEHGTELCRHLAPLKQWAVAWAATLPDTAG